MKKVFLVSRFVSVFCFESFALSKWWFGQEGKVDFRAELVTEAVNWLSFLFSDLCLQKLKLLMSWNCNNVHVAMTWSHWIWIRCVFCQCWIDLRILWGSGSVNVVVIDGGSVLLVQHFLLLVPFLHMIWWILGFCCTTSFCLLLILSS